MSVITQQKSKQSITQLTEQAWTKPTVPKLDAITDIGMKRLWASRSFTRNDGLLKSIEKSFYRKLLQRPNLATNEVVAIPHIPIEELDADSLRPEFFVGSTQNLSYFHCAPLANIFYQINGVKEWRFFAPWNAAWLYPSIGHSRLDAYVASPVITTQQQRNPGQYPLFEFVSKMKARIGSGDVLYNPPWWWHEVSNATESIGIAQRVLASGTLNPNSAFFNAIAFCSPFMVQQVFEKAKQRILHPDEEPPDGS